MRAHVPSDLLTTRAAARMLGVGPTSIKRWADEGILDCVKTAGGHRRIPRAAVAELLRQRHHESPTGAGEWTALSPDEWLDQWIRLLIEDPRPMAPTPVERLAAERIARGSRWQVANALASVAIEIGRRWQVGELTVLEEHVASERLERALARACEDQSLPADAPQCLLVSAPGDDHTLGLALAELCLCEAGWRGWWAGRRTPIDQVHDVIASGRAAMVCVSASAYTTDATLLESVAHRLGVRCRENGVELVLGGSGPWPDEPAYGHRLHDFGDFSRLLAQP